MLLIEDIFNPPLFDTETNTVENVQTFQPTSNFPWNENDPTKPTNQKFNRKFMKLLNYKNMHFNLIIDENDEIVKMLVPDDNTQQHVKPIEPKNGESFKLNEELLERLKIAEKDNKELKAKLSISEDSKMNLNIDHKEAMKEVGKMKEVIEKYKLEIQTLSQYKNSLLKEKAPTPAPCVGQGPAPALKLLIQDHLPAPEQVVTEPTSKSPAPWTTVLPSHRNNPKRTGSGSESNQRNCPKCYFQSSSKEEMNNHFTLSHVASGETNKVFIRTEKITCRNCKVEFENYWSMMIHRRDKHPTDKACRYDLEDRCKHNAEECWYKHKSGKNPNLPTKPSHTNKCFECNMTFGSRNDLMMHKKSEHVEQCKPCVKYAKNECSRENACWFPHTQNQDFHINQLNPRPPINTSH